MKRLLTLVRTVSHETLNIIEETVSKYAVFCTKFLRCAIETLKNVKAKGNDLIEVTDALKLGKMKHVNIFSCCLGVRSFLSS